jgi:hypothetical protein
MTLLFDVIAIISFFAPSPWTPEIPAPHEEPPPLVCFEPNEFGKYACT